MYKYTSKYEYEMLRGPNRYDLDPQGEAHSGPGRTEMPKGSGYRIYGSQKSWEERMQFVCDRAERPAGSILQCYWLAFHAHLPSLPHPVSLVSRITDFSLCRG